MIPPDRRNDFRHCVRICVLTLVLSISSAVSAHADELSEAAQRGDAATVEQLLANEGGAKGPRGFYALQHASRTGQLRVMEMLLKAGTDPNQVTTQNRQLPLLLAITAKHPEAAALLLRHGADPNLSGKCQEFRCSGHPALIPAVVFHQHEIVKMLLARGADVHWKDDLPTQQANMDNDDVMFQMLTNAGGKPWSVHPFAQARGKASAASAGEASGSAVIPTSGLGHSELLPGDAAPLVARPPTGERCRLAIIADQANQPAADLLTTYLQEQPGMELVERNELDRILAEQKLAGELSLDRATASRLGQLLRADALLLLRNRQIAKEKVTETRLIRVSAGLVLATAYRAAGVESVEKWAEQTAKTVGELSARVVSKDAIAVSLLNVRSSLATPLGKQLESALTALLAQRLSREPGMILLERNDMERLATEVSNDEGGGFWTGRYVAGGTVEPTLDGSGRFTLTLQFQPAGGATPITVTAAGDQQAPAKALDTALAGLRTKLKRQAPPAGKPDEEAQRYVEEARWAERFGLYKQAYEAAEVAWNLGIKTPEVAGLRLLGASRQLQSEYYAVSSRFDENAPYWFRRNLLNHPLRAPGAMGAAEFISTGQRVAELWREPIVMGLFQDQAALTEWFGKLEEMSKGASLPLVAVDTVVERSRHQERLNALRETLRETFVFAYGRAKMLPPESKLLNLVAKLQVRSVALVHPEGAELLKAWQELCSLTFPQDNFSTRMEIRYRIRGSAHGVAVVVSVPGMHKQSTACPTPWAAATLPQLMASLRASKAAEDQVTALQWDYFAAPRGSEPQVRAGLALFEVTQRIVPELAEDSELMDRQLSQLDSLTHLRRMNEAGAIFSLRTIADGDGGFEQRSPELHELRRKLLISLIEADAKPTMALHGWLDKKQYTAAEAEQVRAAVRPWLARIKGQPRVNFSMDYKFLEFVAAGDPTLSEESAPPDALVVTRAWHGLQHGIELAEREEFSVWASSFTWAEDSVWFYGYKMPDPWERKRQMRRYVFRVKPETFETEKIELPFPPPGDDLSSLQGGSWKREGTFVVTSERIFFSAQDRYLAVYTRDTRQWQIIPGLIPARGRIFIVDNRLFVPVQEDRSNALLMVDTATWKSEVLISARRHPAQSPLDGPQFYVLRVEGNKAGEIEVYAARSSGPGQISEVVAHAWSPATNTWRLIHGPQPPAPYGNPMAFHPGFTRIQKVAARGTPPNYTSRLTVQLTNGAQEQDEIPVRFDASTASPPLPEQRSKFTDLRHMSGGQWLGCEAGLIFPHYVSGPGFWFLPRRDFEAYLASRQLPPLDLTKPE